MIPGARIDGRRGVVPRVEAASSGGGSDPFWQIPLEMAQLASSGEAPTSRHIDALRSYLDLRTLDFASSNNGGELSRCDVPGYLETCISEKRVLVPFHLGSFFPSDDILAEVVGVAERVALVIDNPICISGSMTFLKVFRSIGDLDYCEYYPGDPRILAECVKAKTVAEQEDLLLVEIKCGAKHHRPWKDLDKMLEAALVPGGVLAPPEPIKLDFLSTTSLGVLPTTSLVLPVKEDAEAGNAERSFAYQEAVICQGEPPRTLLRPESMGRYLNWLLEDARKWLSAECGAPKAKRAPKALKRLLSIALLLGETRLVEEVVEGLKLPPLEDVGIMSRADEVKGMLGYISESLMASHVERLERELESLAFAEDDIQIALEEVLGIGHDVLEEVELLLAPSGEPK